MADTKTEHKDHSKDIEALHAEIRELKNRVHELELHRHTHHEHKH